MEIVGYADRFSVCQEEALNIMVSCRSSEYEATLVRLIHGDDHPLGPGFKEEVIDSPLNGRYPGREQRIHAGSYVQVSDAAALTPSAGFTIQAWVYPTTPAKGRQGLLTKWEEAGSGGFGLFIDKKGALEFQLRNAAGKVHSVNSGRALRARTWYFVAVSFDPAKRSLRLYQEPVYHWPRDDSRVGIEAKADSQGPGKTKCPILIAAYWRGKGDFGHKRVDGHFNGKIEHPRLFGSALAAAEIDQLRRGKFPDGLLAKALANWDFSKEVSGSKAVDRSKNGFDGVVVNAPGRAMTGHHWDGRHTKFTEVPEQYGAIYFHDDDLDDARWDRDFELKVPKTLRSGVYAIRLKTKSAFDYVPFFIRPAKGKASADILFLAPTLSYMAYGDEHLPSRPGRTDKILKMSLEELLSLGSPYEQAAFRYMEDNHLTSLYDFHTDASGVAYSTRLRPIVTFRPLYRKPITQYRATHQFNEDMYLVDWLIQMGHKFDVATDEDLHFEGTDLLGQYRVVVTGSHPEYWSDAMLTALEAYLNGGGRLMYLGGNGFYWVTSFDPERPHIIECRRSEAGVRTWQADPGEYYHSTTGELGGLWRYREKVPQRIVGNGMTATGGEPARPYRRLPAADDPRAAWMFEGIEDRILGDFGLHFGAAAGWELDRADVMLGTPPHALVVATSFGHSDVYQLSVEDLWKTDPTVGGTRCPDVRADMMFFEYPNGGAVFSVGSISYCGSLSFNDYKNNISALTNNVLNGFNSSDPPWVPKPSTKARRPSAIAKV